MEYELSLSVTTPNNTTTTERLTRTKKKKKKLTVESAWEERRGEEEEEEDSPTWVPAVVFLLRYQDRKRQQVRGKQRLGFADLIKPAARMEFFGVGWALNERNQLLLHPLSRAWEMRIMHNQNHLQEEKVFKL